MTIDEHRDVRAQVALVVQDVAAQAGIALEGLPEEEVRKLARQVRKTARLYFPQEYLAKEDDFNGPPETRPGTSVQISKPWDEDKDGTY